MSRARPAHVARITFALAAAPLLLAGCAKVSEGVEDTGFVSTHGEKVASNRWLVTAGVLEAHGEDEALYRAAVLAKAGGYSYFQVVGYDDSLTGGDKYQIVGATTADPPRSCDAGEYEKYHCRTENTDATLSKIGWKLGKTPERIAAEVNTARMQGAATR